jgi:TorA maturation chaperone TorD
MSEEPFRATLAELCATFDVPLVSDAELPGDYTLFESLYLACFEVGLPTPPVPLLASHYNRREPVPATIHEHVLFYKRFGVRLAPGNIEPADHLCNELSFLIRLDELILEGVVPSESLLAVRHDFLTRHPARWLPQALTAAQTLNLPEVYVALINLLTRAVAQDVELTLNGVVSK